MRVISIIDDDVSVRRALQRLIRAAGYAVETFASAPEFFDWFSPGRTACLLLDIHLEGGANGFEVHEQLSEHQAGVPIIFITAHDDAATRERVRRSGAAAYLRKPFDRRALLDAIHKAVASPPLA